MQVADTTPHWDRATKQGRAHRRTRSKNSSAKASRVRAPSPAVIDLVVSRPYALNKCLAVIRP